MLINTRSSNCLCREGQSQDTAWPTHGPVLTSAFPSPAWSVGAEPVMYKLRLWAKPHLLPVAVNQVLLKHNSTHLLMCVCVCFCVKTEEQSSCDKDLWPLGPHVACTPLLGPHVACMPLLGSHMARMPPCPLQKGLLTPGVEDAEGTLWL